MKDEGGNFRLHPLVQLTVCERIYDFSIGPDDIQFNRDGTIKLVSGAGQTGIVGANRHLDRVQRALVIFAAFDQCLRGLPD